MKKIWCDLCNKEIPDDQTHMIKKLFKLENGRMVEVLNEEWDQCPDCTLVINEYILQRKEQIRVRE